MGLSRQGPWETVPADAAEGESYDDLIGKIAREIVSRELTVPAILFLESVKPLSFLGNQLLVFLDPVVSLVVTSGEYQRFVRMLEDRGNLEKLITVIEEENALEEARRREERSRRPRRGLKALLGRRRGPAADQKGDGIARQGDHQDTGN